MKVLLFTVFSTLILFSSKAQIEDYSFGDGFRFTAKDSTFGIKASFRFQTLMTGNWIVNNDDFNDIGNFNSNFLIRRSRLKFNGFAYSPKLTYKVELGLSNRDINHGGTQYYGEGGNIVLDAFLKYNFYKGFSIKVGQSKVAGNRERVISSAKMQFVNRSALNSEFNLDRDIGASLHYDGILGKQFGLHLTAALAKGDGRNIISENRGGYQTTFKLEVMPFGEFLKKGAYVGGDIYREQKPKLAVAITLDKNGKASRTRGNRGDFLPLNAQLKDLYTGFADFMFKYKGVSIMGEYAIRRTIDNKRAINDATGNNVANYHFGTAANLQAGYLFISNYEIAARYTYVSKLPTFGATPQSLYYTLAASKYITNHSLKIQTDVSYIQNRLTDDGLQWRIQIEIGF